MARCFVIQPFSPEFDRIYDTVFAPAISDAGMEAYRVDTEPHVSVPVENIEAGIKDADACLADISADNPNVWYELGFAIANGKPVVIVCSDDRPGPLPFDVQHRNILRYCYRPDDVESFRSDITGRLRRVHGSRRHLQHLAASRNGNDIAGLRAREAAALLSVASNCLTTDASVHPSQVKHDLEPCGFSAAEMSLALDSLRGRDMLCEIEETDAKGNKYSAFTLSGAGRKWLQKHQDKLLDFDRTSSSA